MAARKVPVVVEIPVEVRHAILDRFARLKPSGKPVLCVPTRAELSGGRPRVNTPGNDGKIIFDTRELAEACAKEFLAVGGVPQIAYRCNRGKRGHHHLRRETSTAKSRRGW